MFILQTREQKLHKVVGAGGGDLPKATQAIGKELGLRACLSDSVGL